MTRHINVLAVNSASICLIALCLQFIRIIPETAQAENWPCWRGPRGDGSSAEPHVPTKWNGTTGEGIVWKTKLTGQGHSSPIVWDNHLFLTACEMDSQDRVLQCYDVREGKLKWSRAVMHAPLETKHDLNSFASGTPATDGELIYVSFLKPHQDASDAAAKTNEPKKKKSVTPGTMVVAAFDLQGELRWQVEPGEFASVHGFCSSPVLYGSTVIVNGDHDGESYIVALDRATGKTIWKQPRVHKTRSYVTPLIREVGGQTQMVFSGSKQIVSLDPRDGSTLWKIEGPTEQFVASMVFDGSRFFMTAGFPDYHVMAIRGDGRGDVTDSHVAWHSTDAKCYVPSPVVVGGYLLIADDRGTGNCFNAETGERVWLERLGKHYSASLVSAGGLVYFTADDGITKVVKPGDKLDVVAENPLGEYTFASPAIAAGRIYLRGDQHLFCIGTK